MNKILTNLISMILLPVMMSGCGANLSSTVSPSTPAQTLPPLDLPDLLARLHWLGHASFRFDGPPTIYFDPVASFKNEPPPADIILISHSHNDHYSISTLKRISNSETVIIASPSVATLAPLDGIPGKVHSLHPGERMTIGAVEIEVVPAYNLNKPYHPKEAGALGFIVTLYGRRIYFAGDTDLIPEMADIHAEVAILPVGGTYTMDAEEAAQAIALIKPTIAIPMHTLNTNLNQLQELCHCEVMIMKEE